MGHGIGRGDDRIKRNTALSLGRACLVAVAVPALVYIGVIVARYDGRPYLQGDCQYYFYAAVSLFEDRDVDLTNNLPAPLSRHSDDVSLDRKGRLVPKHPIWMAVFALPFVVAFGAPGALFFNLTQLLLLLFLVFRFTRRFASPWASALATAATGVLSILPHYVWNFSPDVFSCLLLVAGLTALPADRSPSGLPALPCGNPLWSGRRFEVLPVSCPARPPTRVRSAFSEIHSGPGPRFCGADGLLVCHQPASLRVGFHHLVRPHGKNRGRRRVGPHTAIGFRSSAALRRPCPGHGSLPRSSLHISGHVALVGRSLPSGSKGPRCGALPSRHLFGGLSLLFDLSMVGGFPLREPVSDTDHRPRLGTVGLPD